LNLALKLRPTLLRRAEAEAETVMPDIRIFSMRSRQRWGIICWRLPAYSPDFNPIEQAISKI
jgi:hypothetical protein